jgi:hypothetical protein
MTFPAGLAAPVIPAHLARAGRDQRVVRLAVPVIGDAVSVDVQVHTVSDAIRIGIGEAIVRLPVAVHIQAIADLLGTGVDLGIPWIAVACLARREEPIRHTKAPRQPDTPSIAVQVLEIAQTAFSDLLVGIAVAVVVVLSQAGFGSFGMHVGQLVVAVAVHRSPEDPIRLTQAFGLRRSESVVVFVPIVRAAAQGIGLVQQPIAVVVLFVALLGCCHGPMTHQNVIHTVKLPGALSVLVAGYTRDQGDVLVGLPVAVIILAVALLRAGHLG